MGDTAPPELDYASYMVIQKANALRKRKSMVDPTEEVTVVLPGARLRRNLPPKEAGGPRADLAALTLHGKRPRTPKEVVEQ